MALTTRRDEMTPIKTIAPPDWMSDPDVGAVFAALQDAGDPEPAVLFVGGCVRDALMDRPVGDVDVASVHPPDIALARLRAAGIDVLEIGIEHGTVVAHFGHKMFQVTTLRVDVETFGRHAKVAYTDDWSQDASRRDFTMNALYADLDGNIYDPLGGLADLEARRIRFIGDPAERIDEDALRVLRFFRFHAQLEDSEIDPDGLAACRASAGRLANLSGERIREELFKLLAGENAAIALQLAIETGVLAAALPDLTSLGVYPHDGYLHCLSEIEKEHDRVDPLRRFALLVENPEIAHAVGRRLHLSNVERRRLERMAARDVVHPSVEARVRYRDRPEAPPEPDPEAGWRETDMRALLLPRAVEEWLRNREARRRARLLYEMTHAQKVKLYELGRDGWRDAVLLSWAFVWVSEHSKSSEAWVAVLEAPERHPVPVFSLRGADVIAAGVPEGPDVSRLLKAVERWWIDGGFAADREACLAELRRRVRSG